MRAINELIWHCTATPAGREVTRAEIDSWHKARGWKGIGYHKVVHLDGSVSEGRPESEVGAHVEGHNTGTIGYTYVGGVDGQMNPLDTRTLAQRATMERLTREAIQRYGLKKVSGHHDYAAKACPCFPARAEYAPLLGGSVRPTPVTNNGRTAIGAGTVTADSLNLRDRPNGTITGSMPRGTKLQIHGGDGDWLLVQTPAGYRGWAHRDYVRADDAGDAA